MEKYELIKDILVMYVPAASFPEGINEAFENLESKLPPAIDRAYFGISRPGSDGKILYKAAAEEKYKGEGNNYGLEVFTIRKGAYISDSVQDYKQNIPAIGETFRQLLEHPDLDTNSYCLEWYKGNDVVCMVRLNQLKEI